MIEKPRNIILHGHIFKNAGTTIDWILERNFGKNFLDDREDVQMRNNSDYLASLLEQQLIAIASHSLPLPPKPIKGVIFHTIVLLRNPILRVRSVYDFERKQKGKTPGAIHAKKFNFKEYVQWRMRDDVAVTIRDFQTRFLTQNSLPKSQNLSDEHLKYAIDYVKNNPLTGLVEHFDESLNIFKTTLDQFVDDFNIDYEIQNVTQKKRLSESEKLSAIQQELGTELFETLLNKNSNDIKLYEAATEIIQSRFRDNNSLTTQKIVVTH